MTPRKPTRAEAVATMLADDIVSGRRAPGMALDETSLAQDYGVSRTPVREALRLVAAAGLIQVRPHRGAVVARPDEAQLSDMFIVMAELEGLCAALSAVAMTTGERRGLHALHERMSGMVREGALDAYAEANVAFHVSLYDGSHNHYLAELAAQTRQRLAPFRRAQLGAADRLQRSHREHSAVVEAIDRGDSEGASRIMREHIGLTAKAWEVLRGSKLREPV